MAKNIKPVQERTAGARPNRLLAMQQAQTHQETDSAIQVPNTAGEKEEKVTPEKPGVGKQQPLQEQTPSKKSGGPIKQSEKKPAESVELQSAKVLTSQILELKRIKLEKENQGTKITITELIEIAIKEYLQRYEKAKK